MAVSHQGTVRAEPNPIDRGIRGNEHVHFRIMFERFLHLQAFVSTHAAVAQITSANGDNL